MNNHTERGLDCATLKWMRHLLPSHALSDTLTDMLIEKEKDKPFLLRIIEDKNALKTVVKTNSRFPYLKNEICEENNNQKWIDPKAYSRRIVIEEYKGGFYIRETEYFPYRLDSHIAESYSNVIGWKRVVTDN